MTAIRSTDVHRTKKDYPAHANDITTEILQRASFPRNLLRAQGDDGIDLRCTQRGDVAGEDCDYEEHQ